MFIPSRANSPPAAHCCTGAEISQTPWLPHCCGAARDLRFMLLCVEPRVIWRSSWNEILTIFDPYTFSHTPGQKEPGPLCPLPERCRPLAFRQAPPASSPLALCGNGEKVLLLGAFLHDPHLRGRELLSQCESNVRRAIEPHVELFVTR